MLTIWNQKKTNSAACNRLKKTITQTNEPTFFPPFFSHSGGTRSVFRLFLESNNFEENKTDFAFPFSYYYMLHVYRFSLVSFQASHEPDARLLLYYQQRVEGAAEDAQYLYRFRIDVQLCASGGAPGGGWRGSSPLPGRLILTLVASTHVRESASGCCQQICCSRTCKTSVIYHISYIF